MAAFGSTIRKYATALTRTGTLSLVITSCGGTVSVIVRRSTLTIRSTTGISRNSPGPFGAGSRRPSLKTIPRSYSRATLIAAKRNRTIRNSRIAMMMSAASITGSYVGAPTPAVGGRPASLRLVLRPHGQDEPVQRLDAYTLAGEQGVGTQRSEEH